MFLIELSDLALANKETLARGENDPNAGSGVRPVDSKDANGRVTERKCI